MEGQRVKGLLVSVPSCSSAQGPPTAPQPLHALLQAAVSLGWMDSTALPLVSEKRSQENLSPPRGKNLHHLEKQMILKSSPM